MKIYVMFLVLSISFLLNSCCDDCNVTPDTNKTVVGIWERSVTNNDNKTFLVYLLLKENGDLAFLLGETVDGHTNTYTSYIVNGSQIVIQGDTDCPDDAVYNFELSAQQLTLYKHSDNCDPREFILKATWNKVK